MCGGAKSRHAPVSLAFRDAEERQVLIHDADAESLFPNLDYWQAKAVGKGLEDSPETRAPGAAVHHKTKGGAKFPARSDRR